MQIKLFSQLKSNVFLVILVFIFFVILMIPKSTFAEITVGGINYVDANGVCPSNQVLFGQGMNYQCPGCGNQPPYQVYNWCKDVYADGPQAIRNYNYTYLASSGVSGTGIINSNYCPYDKFLVGSARVWAQISRYGWYDVSGSGLVKNDPRYTPQWQANVNGGWLPATSVSNLRFLSRERIGFSNNYITYYNGNYIYRVYGQYSAGGYAPVMVCDSLSANGGPITHNNYFYSYYDYALRSDSSLVWWYSHCGHGTNGLATGLGSYPSQFMCTNSYSYTQLIPGPFSINFSNSYCDGGRPYNRIAWSNSSNASYYLVWRSDVGYIATVYGNAYSDYSVNHPNNYSYWVLAVNSTSNKSIWSSNGVVIQARNCVNPNVTLNAVCPPESEDCQETPTYTQVDSGQPVKLIWNSTPSGLSVNASNFGASYASGIKTMYPASDILYSISVNYFSNISTDTAEVRINQVKVLNGIFIANEVDFNNSEKIKLSQDQNVINNPPPGFNDIFAPVWKELVP